MAGHDLSIDMGALEQLATDLTTIVDEFNGADSNSEQAGSATGHHELGEVVEDFADKWRVKREEMTGNVQSLQEIVQQIVDTFSEVDGELARALEEKAQQVPGRMTHV